LEAGVVAAGANKEAMDGGEEAELEIGGVDFEELGAGWEGEVVSDLFTGATAFDMPLQISRAGGRPEHDWEQMRASSGAVYPFDP
jgi:hypothetical protein